ncbi:ACP S-malonyltransferase [Streptomyces sp. NBC_01092]|nr:ACP S-malonyltransferase [Streptomyces sp. NBC_01092]
MQTGLAALFPGIGAQRVGMGKKLFERFTSYRDTLAEASDELGEDVPALIFEAANRARLARQEEAQLTTFVTGVAMYRTYAAELDLRFDFLAGHSLGELTALCCSGALGFAEALRLVRRRADIIRDTADSLDGTMVWVIGIAPDAVEGVCRRVAGGGPNLVVSAVDAPRQVAISGETDLVGRAAELLEARGGRVFPLRMEGPYHSPLMAEAARRMADVLRDVHIARPNGTVLSTVDGRHHPGGDGSRALLADQLISPVHWLTVQRRLVEANVPFALECGPGNVLTFLLGKTTQHMRLWPLERYDCPDALMAELALGTDDYPDVVRRCLALAASTPCRTQPAPAERDRMDRAYASLRELDRAAAAGEPVGRRDVDDALTWIGWILETKGWQGADRESRLRQVFDGRVLAA